MAALLAAFVLAVTVHEAGHAFAAIALGRRPRLFVRWPWTFGVAVPTIGRGADGLVALAGPAASLALAYGAILTGHSTVALVSGLLGLLNLLPVPRSDGSHIVRAVRR